MPSLRLGIVGDTRAAMARRQSLARLRQEVAGFENTEGLEGVDVLFVASPPAMRHVHAVAAVRQGVAVFAEWPPAPALSDVQALVAAAAEAGVPVGTSRPLRFQNGLAGAVPCRLVVARRTLPPGTPLLTAHTLADLADLCRYLTGSAALTRIEAHAERDATRAAQALAFALRFQNGAYAQVAVHPADDAHLHVYACAGSDAHSVDLEGDAPPDALLDAETGAFLDAVAARQPAPVTALDALQTLRLVEKLWTQLR